jgi:hypothetical protein
MKNKLLLLALGLAPLARASCAQALSRSRIDSLTTTRQVQQFVRSRDANYNNYRAFRLSDSTDVGCEALRACIKPNARNWAKADFDGDGRVDLLVKGYGSRYSGDSRIICFLDKGTAGIQEIPLSGNSECAVPQLGLVQGKPVIYYAYLQVQGARFTANRKLVCRRDTLVFNKTGFREYNRAPKDYKIEKVAFATTACYGTCPIFSLQIKRSGAATYHAEEYNPKIGEFTAVVQAQPLAEIWTLLNYLHFPRLQNNYSISATDYPTCTLTITYGGGKVKTIADYGEQGTFGLRQVYDLLFALRTTQVWQRVQAH